MQKERDYIPLSFDEATVWSGEYEQSRPTLDEAHELFVLRGLDSGYTARMSSLEELTDVASLARWRAVVGGWLAVVIGRGSPTARESAVLQPIVNAMLDGAGESG